MATWIAHMRIAEYFIKKYDYLNSREFLVGNIAPDCGVPNEDWSEFTPNKQITHWRNKEDTAIDAEDFYKIYLLGKNNNDENFPFYLGYYFHLLTDIEWAELYRQKKRETIYADGLAKDKSFIWEIKKDWYGQDHLFLQNNPDFIFYTMFAKIDNFPNVYFNFYPDEAFIRQIKYITNFYLTSKENPEREFPYLTKAMMDCFVKHTIMKVENVLIKETGVSNGFMV